MTRKTHRSVSRIAVVAAVLLGLGVAASPATAGDRDHHRHHRDRGDTDQAQLFGQIVVSLLGAAQPQAVHYYHPAPRPHPRRVWNYRHRHAEPQRDCSMVTRIVTDRFGHRTRVVTRHCVDFDHRRRFHHHGR